ncbi:hypothetical protein C900_00719 [Fulvivirga imtechensis AK7]|uniref:Uncharacterized protein n=1 Tax=Fulvivirga imtechensis AK7 TaxID=1237149 RepID=L8JIR0_9BACT|nr:hypothetical protein C900_00719 [Fulvivirga imtechensis AK7]
MNRGLKICHKNITLYGFRKAITHGGAFPGSGGTFRDKMGWSQKSPSHVILSR